MAFKIFAGIVAMTLLVVYIGAPAIKLKDAALAVVALVGIAMAAVDLWQSLRED